MRVLPVDRDIYDEAERRKARQLTGKCDAAQIPEQIVRWVFLRNDVHAAVGRDEFEVVGGFRFPDAEQDATCPATVVRAAQE